MIDPKLAPAPSSQAPDADPRPAYEPPRVHRKKAVHRATLFSGGSGPPSSTPPLVSHG
jgi:hypothetical protein